MWTLTLSMCTLVFFKQKTAYEMRISDWSSDVCSSDLVLRQIDGRMNLRAVNLREKQCGQCGRALFDSEGKADEGVGFGIDKMDVRLLRARQWRWICHD